MRIHIYAVGQDKSLTPQKKAQDIASIIIDLEDAGIFSSRPELRFIASPAKVITPQTFAKGIPDAIFMVCHDLKDSRQRLIQAIGNAPSHNLPKHILVYFISGPPTPTNTIQRARVIVGRNKSLHMISSFWHLNGWQNLLAGHLQQFVKESNMAKASSQQPIPDKYARAINEYNSQN